MALFWHLLVWWIVILAGCCLVSLMHGFVNATSCLHVFGLSVVKPAVSWLRPWGRGLHSECESKNPPKVFWHFFRNAWEIFDQILHACYTFLSMLDYKFLCNYLQLWLSYAILCATTQFTSYVQNVHHWPKCTSFRTFFPNSWEFLVQILHTYYMFLSMLDYKFLFNYLQVWLINTILSATTQHAFRLMVDILSV